MTKEYNYKNCSSLFGYSAKVHIRFKAQCQLCGCGDPLDFDLWRQMTVEHLIGKSQGGYLKEIKKAIKKKFSNLSSNEIITLSEKINELNTVTCCQFCNSTTCRDRSDISMKKLIKDGIDDKSILNSIEVHCQKILKEKKEKVKWKLGFIKTAFEKEVASKINEQIRAEQ